jgi:hypothetical protein
VEPLASSQQAIQPAAQIICPFCSTLVDTTAFFCSVCGKNVKEKPLSTGILTQIGLYLVSVFLPPLFLGLTIKYLKSKDPKAKQVGMISLGLTVITLIVVIWLSISVAKNLTRTINQQFNQYENLGL